MQLSEIGIIVKEEWLRTAVLRPNTQLDSYIVMPNHIHGIIVLNRYTGISQPDNSVGANCHSPQNKRQNDTFNNRAYIDTPLQNKFHSPSNTIGAIVRGFKSATTKRIKEIHGILELQFWQRNYFDHVIRNDKELGNIREYIDNNVIQWAFENDNPDNVPLW